MLSILGNLSAADLADSGFASAGFSALRRKPQRYVFVLPLPLSLCLCLCCLSLLLSGCLQPMKPAVDLHQQGSVQ